MGKVYKVSKEISQNPDHPPHRSLVADAVADDFLKRYFGAAFLLQAFNQGSGIRRCAACE
jgi:hypothetical protein